MAFPQTPLPVVVELFYDDVWNDITRVSSVAYVGGHPDSINITRGRSNEAGQVEASRCSLRLNNRDGRFSPRNPLSPLYGKIGRNTPLRVRINADIRFSGEVPAWPQRWDRTGNDVWVPIEAAGILRRLGQGAKPLNSALYRAISTHPNVVAYWPGEDNAGSTEAASPLMGVAPLSTPGADFAAIDGPPGSGRLLRVVTGTRSATARVPNHTPGDVYVVQVAWRMDEAAAASRHILNVYTTSSNRARWLVRVTPTTFNLQAFDSDGSLVVDETQARNDDLFGQWLRAEFRWRSGASAVATLTTADVAALELNSASGAPGTAGRIVAVGVGDDGGVWGQDRFFGHLSVFTGTVLESFDWDLHPPFHGFTGELAADRFERLCDEEDFACSVIAPTGGLNLPDEDGSDASTPDAAALDIVGDIELSAWLSVQDWADGNFRDIVSKWDDTVDQRSYALRLNNDGEIGILWTTDGTAATSSHVQSPPLVPLQLHAGFRAVRATLDVDNGAAGHDVNIYVGPSIDGPWTSIHSQTVAGITSIHSGTADLVVGRDSTGAGTFSLEGVVRAARVYDGIDGTLAASPDFQAQEVGATSFDDAQGNTWTINGTAAIVRADDTTAMGPQQIDTVLANLRACALADQGILYEPRELLELRFRTRTTLYNQAAALELDYTDGVFSSIPEPVDDDQLTRNDITVTRPTGSSHRAVLETGALSVQPPPDGVGIYDTSLTVNLAGDGQLSNDAAWRLSLGTADEPRFPSLALHLHNSIFSDDAALTADAAGLDLGDRVTVNNLPDWVSHDLVSQMAQGFKERLSNFLWFIKVNASPYSPFNVGVYESAVGPGEHSRYDTAGSSLASAFNAGTDTSMSVNVDILPPWTTAAGEMPFDIEVGGVRLTVTAISGASSPQTFTIAQTPVNGVVKTIPAGTPVSLWTKARYAL